MFGVMLVDDEQIILQGLIKVIPWEKYQCRVVDTASDGLEGLKKIREHRPELLITDIRMPNLDGLSMIAALKSEFPHMQIAVLTAYRDFDYAQRAMHLGVSRYLLKPSKLDQIEEAVSFMTAQLPAQEEAGETAAGEEASPAGAFVVKEAVKFIENHCTRHLSLSDVAENVFVSQWHLSKLLNRHTGKTFFDLVNQARVRRARELLKDPSLRVHEVAEKVGFADVAHFSKIFKKLTGKTPGEYRSGL